MGYCWPACFVCFEEPLTFIHPPHRCLTNSKSQLQALPPFCGKASLLGSSFHLNPRLLHTEKFIRSCAFKLFQFQV
jgi:hypothetical protein